MNLVIKNANLNGVNVDCLIEDGVYKTIAPGIEISNGYDILDANGNYIVPPFFNCHTHSPMNLLRGIADDLPLFTWLSKHIWPLEAKLTSEDIRNGAMLSASEMIRSGTVFYNDMYWSSEEAIVAADKSGMRAVIGIFIIDEAPGMVNSKCRASEELTLEAYSALSLESKKRIKLSYAPHAVYSVSEKTLLAVAEKARSADAFIHIHASETREEFENCQKEHGMTPIAWIDRCGLLTQKTILAHCVHLTEDDMSLIAERGAIISHQPCSNYKLCSGQFDYHRAVECHKCRFVIGTDGCASNNNLSMFDEMKLAALNAKITSGDPTSGRAEDIFYAATRGGAEAFGIDSGEIMEGMLGDALLIDKDAVQMKPCHNLISNLVYSADTSVVASVVCNGRILLRNWPRSICQ